MKKVKLRTDFEISDDVFDRDMAPFLKDLDEWFELRKDIIPKFVAFYIAKGVEHNTIWRGSFDGLVNGAVESLAGYIVDKNVEKIEVINLLHDSYGINVVESEQYPMVLEIDK